MSKNKKTLSKKTMLLLTTLAGAGFYYGAIHDNRDTLDTMSPTDLKTTFNQKSGTHTYMSKETMKLLGEKWADDIAEWAQKDVLVISDQDVKKIQLLAKKGILKKIWDLAVPKLNEHLSKPTEEKEKADILRKLFPDFPISQESNRILANLFDNALYGSPSSFTLQKNNDQCIITMPNEDWKDAETYFANLSSLDVGDIENVPGSREAWQLAVMMHEAFHCRDDTAEKARRTPQFTLFDNSIFEAVLSEEYGADQFTISLMRQFIKEGKKEFEGIPEALTLSRSIGAFLREIEVHSHGGALSPDSDDAKRVYTPVQILQALKHPHTEILSSIGKDNIDTEDKGIALLNTLIMLNKDRDVMTALENALWPENGKQNLNIIEEILKKYKDDLDVKTLYPTYLKKEMVYQGIKAANQDPSLLYKTAKEMLKDGVFDHNELGKKYVERAVKGMEKYAPDLTKKSFLSVKVDKRFGKLKIA